MYFYMQKIIFAYHNTYQSQNVDIITTDCNKNFAWTYVRKGVNYLLNFFFINKKFYDWLIIVIIWQKMEN